MSRDDELLIRSALSARLPWLSADAEIEPEYMYSTDPQELIDQCCNCTKAYCVNCIAGYNTEALGRPPKGDANSFAELIRCGLSMSQVCKALGIGKSTFYRYKSELNMKGAIA